MNLLVGCRCLTASIAIRLLFIFAGRATGEERIEEDYGWGFGEIGRIMVELDGPAPCCLPAEGQ